MWPGFGTRVIEHTGSQGDSSEENPSTDAPKPSAWSRVLRWSLPTAATALDVTAEALRASGRDGLAAATSATAHLLRLVRALARNPEDQR